MEISIIGKYNMSALDNQPENINGITPINWRFQMKRLPGVNYFARNATLPGLTLGDIPIDNFFVRIPTAGDKITFEPYNIRFMVDEDMTNYMEIYNWIIGLGFPENFTQSIHRPIGGTNIDSRVFSGVSDKSDATLMMLTSHKNPNVEVTFRDMFPITLSSLDFDVEQTTVEYLQADVTFAYKDFTIRTI